MATTINQLTVEEFQKHFNRLPVNYKITDKEFITFKGTLNSLYDLYMSIGIDNRVEKDIRTISSDLKELGFKQIGLFWNKLTGERIALIAV